MRRAALSPHRAGGKGPRLVFKRKRLILALFLVVAAGISLAVWSVPTTYEVVGKLVVTRARGDLLVTPADLRNFNFTVTAPTLQDMAVHAELLKNRSLVEAVIRKLGLDRARQEAQAKAPDGASAAAVSRIAVWIPWAGGASSPAAPEQDQLNIEADTILNGLATQVVPNSNLIYVRYRSSDPVKGAEIVNTLLDLYREAYLEVRGTAGVARLFEEQRDRLSAGLKKSEATLAAFESRTALLAAPVQVDAYARRLAEAEDNAIDSQYDLQESEQRADLLKKLLDEQPERILGASTIKHNPMIETMHDRLLALEMDKQRLLTLYTDDSRFVQDKQAEIDAQQQRLAEARAHEWVPNSEVTQLNERRRDLEAEYLAATLAIERNRTRVEGSRALASEMCDRVRELGVDDVEREALLREIQAGTDAYLLYRKKAEEARVTAALDDNKIANVAIGELASREGSPVDPPKNLSYVFAVLMGLVSGVGGAFLREFFDGSVRSEREIRAVVELPVLGSIPEARKGRSGKNGAEA